MKSDKNLVQTDTNMKCIYNKRKCILFNGRIDMMIGWDTLFCMKKYWNNELIGSCIAKNRISAD